MGKARGMLPDWWILLWEFLRIRFENFHLLYILSSTSICQIFIVIFKICI